MLFSYMFCFVFCAWFPGYLMSNAFIVVQHVRSLHMLKPQVKGKYCFVEGKAQWSHAAVLLSRLLLDEVNTVNVEL